MYLDPFKNKKVPIRERNAPANCRGVKWENFSPLEGRKEPPLPLSMGTYGRRKGFATPHTTTLWAPTGWERDPYGKVPF